MLECMCTCKCACHFGFARRLEDRVGISQTGTDLSPGIDRAGCSCR